MADFGWFRLIYVDQRSIAVWFSVLLLWYNKITNIGLGAIVVGLLVLLEYNKTANMGVGCGGTAALGRAHKIIRQKNLKLSARFNRLIFAI